MMTLVFCDVEAVLVCAQNLETQSNWINQIRYYCWRNFEIFFSSLDEITFSRIIIILFIFRMIGFSRCIFRFAGVARLNLIENRETQ
jgi:hypothetical protein